MGLALAMFLGIAVYFRLWSIDYSISSDDNELLRFGSLLSLPSISVRNLFFSYDFSNCHLNEVSVCLVFKSRRRQFDLASKEAMDESAEWRLKYDEQAESANKCVKELQEVYSLASSSFSSLLTE